MEKVKNNIAINELDDDISVDLVKICHALWYRKDLIIKVILAVVLFFVLLTFVSTKKYTVSASLYINKTNNSNMAEINPYVISELGAGGGIAAMLSGASSGALATELEIMQSPLVLDKVIIDNDLRYNYKRFGIFKHRKYGQYIPAEALSGKKGIKLENLKGTNVVTIEYKSKNREIAYNVVNSLISNYIVLQKELNTDKAKADKSLIEKEYVQVKKHLHQSLDTVSGIPENALNMTGSLSAMSAFSKPAQMALANLKGQVSQGAKSRAEVQESAVKLEELAKKLEWVKLVDMMSDSSKVIVLKEPVLPEAYENTSPNLKLNIILGLIFGVILSLGAVIYVEIMDKKLTFSMLSDGVIYSIKDNFSDLKIEILANDNKKIGIVAFEKLAKSCQTSLSAFKNVALINADISEDFMNELNKIDYVIMATSVGKTDSKTYKQVKELIIKSNKTILKDVLV